jgi:hypothetical protein
MANTVERVITLRLQRKSYALEKVERYISYNGHRLDFTEQEYNDFLSRIPELWNTDRDRLLYFVLFFDKTYLAQREKDVFNYGTRLTEEKLYNFDEISDVELNLFTSFLVDEYTKLKISRTENFYDEILSKVSDLSYMKFQIIDLRDKLLEDSDYLMMPDYPLDEADREDWKAYRQQLRDITKQQAWIDNDYMNITLPASPAPEKQIIDIFNKVGNTYANAADIPPSILEEVRNNLKGYGITNVIEKFSQISIKVELLRALSALKIPSGVTADEISTINTLIPQSITDIIPENQIKNLQEAVTGNVTNWEAYLNDIDEKIIKLNDTLTKYNVGFTVGDVIQQVATDLKEKADKLDANLEALRLIEQMELSEIEGDN